MKAIDVDTGKTLYGMMDDEVVFLERDSLLRIIYTSDGRVVIQVEVKSVRLWSVEVTLGG